MRRFALAFALTLVACADDPVDPGAGDVGVRNGGTARDAGFLADASVGDSGVVRDAEPTDTGAEDAGSVDTGVLDGGPADGGVEDGGPTDTGPEDAGVPDAGPADTGATDAGRPDAGGCDYIELTVCIVECAGMNTYARTLTDRNSLCPDVVRLLGNDYPDIRAAITGEGCNSACIYKPFQSVSFIDHCGRRNGYIVYRAPGMGCVDLFEFSNGLFTSVSDWEQVTPCP